MSWGTYTVPNPPPDDGDTANYAFRLPDYGGDPNVWGYGLNGNFYVLDIILHEFRTDATKLPIYLPKAGGEVTGVVEFSGAGALGSVAKPAATVSAKSWTVRQPDGAALASCSEAGAITAVNVTATSDARLKKVRRAEDPAGMLAAVLQLRPVQYSWLLSGEEAFGMVAQEVLEHWPQAVHRADDEEGSLSLKLEVLVALLVGAVQGLRNELRELKAGRG